MGKSKKEMFCYLIICIILVIIIILNNMFWKFGKKDDSNTETGINYLESNNIIYNVPYEEQGLDWEE